MDLYIYVYIMEMAEHREALQKISENFLKLKY